jgi:hypothetical protein
MANQSTHRCTSSNGRKDINTTLTTIMVVRLTLSKQGMKATRTTTKSKANRTQKDNTTTNVALRQEEKN